MPWYLRDFTSRKHFACATIYQCSENDVQVVIVAASSLYDAEMCIWLCWCTSSWGCWKCYTWEYSAQDHKSECGNFAQTVKNNITNLDKFQEVQRKKTKNTHKRTVIGSANNTVAFKGVRQLWSIWVPFSSADVTLCTCHFFASTYELISRHKHCSVTDSRYILWPVTSLKCWVDFQKFIRRQR